MQREAVHIYSKADRPSAAILPAYTTNPTPSRDRPSSIPKALLTPQGAGRGAPVGQWSIVSNHPTEDEGGGDRGGGCTGRTARLEVCRDRLRLSVATSQEGVSRQRTQNVDAVKC